MNALHLGHRLQGSQRGLGHAQRHAVVDQCVTQGHGSGDVSVVAFDVDRLNLERYPFTGQRVQELSLGGADLIPIGQHLVVRQRGSVPLRFRGVNGARIVAKLDDYRNVRSEIGGRVTPANSD